jgi:internalin A
LQKHFFSLLRRQGQCPAQTYPPADPRAMSELAQQLIEENRRTLNKTLDLGNCGLSELPDLSGMDWVETLILSDEWWEFDDEKKEWGSFNSQNSGKRNQLEKTPPNYLHLPLLKKLVAGDLGISDGRFLVNSTGLTSLDLSSNKISDWRFLGNLTGLTSLNLSNNQISDGRFLEKLTNLTSLYLSSNQISDGRFLGNLTGLTSLDLSSNKISDGRFLENLTNLTLLYLSSNQISDGRFLEKLDRTNIALPQ